MDVIVDKKYKAKMKIDTFGTFSERILLLFDQPHPIHGKEFMTKYYFFRNNFIEWGFNGQKFEIQYLY